MSLEKLCISVLLAGFFLQHLSMADDVLLLGPSEKSAIQVICSEKQETPLCESFNRWTTASKHYDEISAALDNLNSELYGNYLEEGLVHFQTSCEQEEISMALHMKLACLSLKEVIWYQESLNEAEQKVEEAEQELKKLNFWKRADIRKARYDLRVSEYHLRFSEDDLKDAEDDLKDAEDDLKDDLKDDLDKVRERKSSLDVKKQAYFLTWKLAMEAECTINPEGVLCSLL